MDSCAIYQDRQFRKKENEERHSEFQVPMGQSGGESHEETENTRLERMYSQGYRFRSAKDI